MEDFNLRSAIIAYAATHNASGGAIPAKHKDQLAANDVKWSHGRFESTICTAAANGQIVIYDVTRAGVESARLHEHVRQVHRVAFNPHQGALLLSGSQDASMRLWDLRDLAGDRSIMTCRSSYQYPGNNEGIRDLRWSPTNGVEFAAGTDNGVIQRWDFRKAKAPILKVNAHEKTCHAIDWHPDGKYLLSGGADKMVNVWDFSSTDRRKKACWQLRAPQAVLNVRWRPPRWSAPGGHPGSWNCSQIVTAYDQDPRIHVWDFRRPYMPFREINSYDMAPTALLWHSEDLLWSVGMQGIFAQTDISCATQVADTRSTSVVAISASGQIGIVSDKRARRHRPLRDPTEEFLNRHRTSSVGGEKMSRSHSATDGSFEEASLLSSSLKSRHRKPPSTRSSKSIAGTPPSAGTGVSAVSLEEAMQKESVFQPAQVAAYGYIIGLFDSAAFAFLARNYKSSPAMPSTLLADGEARSMSANFQHNARLAACTHEYRLAQSWRVLSLAVEKDLQAWKNTDDNNRKSVSTSNNLGKQPNHGKARSKASFTRSDHEKASSTSEMTKRRPELVIVQTVGQSSNMTTPTAQPIADQSIRLAGSDHSSSSIGDESLLLPAPAWGESVGESQTQPLSDRPSWNDQLQLHGHAGEDIRPGNTHQTSASLSTDGRFPPRGANAHLPSARGFSNLDTHLSERRAAIENYKVTPRPLLRLDEPVQSPAENVPLSPSPHDTADRFQLFSTSTESSQLVESTTDSSESSQDLEKMEPASERWDAMVRQGAISGASHGKTNGDKETLGGRLEGPLSSLRGSAIHPPQLLPGQSPARPLPSQDLRPSPLVRSPHPERHIVHFDEMEHLGGLDKSNDVMRRDSVSKDETSSCERVPLDRSDTRPWAANSMIDSLINYHTAELCCSQLPANILLQLGPRASSISSALILSILLSYHAQLMSLSLYVQAADLRNQAHPQYPDVVDHGSYGIIPGGPWCTVCQKPSKGHRPRFCQRCNQPWADCPICNGEGAAAVANDKHVPQCDSLWGWCQWCGHGGHVGCLRVWWEMPGISEGGCATAGCLHDCVAGARREEIHQRKAAIKKGSVVRGDEWVVSESRAVERTRSMVGGPAEDGGGSGGLFHGSVNAKTLRGPQGLLSLGMMGRSGSGGKKVRLLAPIDDDRDTKRESEGEGDGTSASAP